MGVFKVLCETRAQRKLSRVHLLQHPSWCCKSDFLSLLWSSWNYHRSSCIWLSHQGDLKPGKWGMLMTWECSFPEFAFYCGIMRMNFNSQKMSLLLPLPTASFPFSCPLGIKARWECGKGFCSVADMAIFLFFLMELISYCIHRIMLIFPGP